MEEAGTVEKAVRQWLRQWLEVEEARPQLDCSKTLGLELGSQKAAIGGVGDGTSHEAI